MLPAMGRFPVRIGLAAVTQRIGSKEDRRQGPRACATAARAVAGRIRGFRWSAGSGSSSSDFAASGASHDSSNARLVRNRNSSFEIR